MDSKKLIGQLAAFGVSPTEARIYLHLLGRPPKSVLEIATDLGLPRTSIYDNAQKLIDKGLVEQIAQHKSHRLRAYPVSILQAKIDEERARINSLQRKLAALEKIAPQAYVEDAGAEVRYYHGTKGLEQMVWNTLRTKDELVGYSQFSLTQAVSQRFVDRYNLELKARSIRNRIITNPENVETWRQSTKPVEDYSLTLQQCRTVDPEKLRISGDTTIYNNTFAVAYWEQGEVLGVEIEHPEIAKIQRSIFELLWSQAQQLDGVI